MISWIIYIIVAFILFFVLYLAIQGIDRGVKAKNANKSNNSKKKSNSPKNITGELIRLKNFMTMEQLIKKNLILQKKSC